MNGSTSVLILITAAMLAVGAAAVAAVLTDDTSDGADPDTSAYWYETEFWGYEYSDGTVVHNVTGDYDDSMYDLDIKTVENNTFSGKYDGKDISGTISDDVLTFYHIVDSGTRALFIGQIMGDMMYVTTTNVETDGTIGAYYAVYSTDPNGTDIPFRLVDISGDWVIQSSKYMSSDGSGTLQGTSLTITEQTGPIFRGTMEQTVDDAVVDISFVGAAGTQSTNGYNIGFITDENGENWYVLIKEDSMILQTSILYTDALAAVSSEERSYVRDGTTVSEDIFDVPDVTGTTWIETRGYASFSLGTVSETYSSCEITIDAQDGRLFTGNMFYCGMYCDIAGFFYDTDRLFIQSTSWKDDEASDRGYYISVCGFCTLDGDDLYITNMSPTTDARYTTGYIHMSSSTTVPDGITGHWDSVLYETVNRSDNTFMIYSITALNDDDGILPDYDLDILSVNNNTAVFSYRGEQIVGSYNGSVLRFIADTEDPDGNECRIDFIGKVVNDHILKSTVTYSYDTGKTVVGSCTYARGDIVAIPDLSILSLNTRWHIADGTAYYCSTDGTEGNLLGNGLLLVSKGSIVVGLISEEVDGNIEQKLYLGTIVDKRSNGDCIGSISDTTGITYMMTVTGGTLVLRTNAESDTGDGGLVSAIRVYLSSGYTEPTVDSIDIGDTRWQSESSKIYYPNGTSETIDGIGMSFSQSEMSGLIYGKFTFDSGTESFVGYGINGISGELKVDGSPCQITIMKTPNGLDVTVYHYGSNQYVIRSTLTEVSG